MVTTPTDARCPGGSVPIIMAQPMKTDHRTNRLLAALGPEDFAALEPDLEIVELSRFQGCRRYCSFGQRGVHEGWFERHPQVIAILDEQHGQGARQGRPGYLR
jgi:hypothetical protein